MELENRRAYHIRKTKTKTLRKYHIANATYWGGYDIKHMGYLRKGKIHCSCPLCRSKVKYNGYKHSDLKKIDCLNYSDV